MKNSITKNIYITCMAYTGYSSLQLHHIHNNIIKWSNLDRHQNSQGIICGKKKITRYNVIVLNYNDSKD